MRSIILLMVLLLIPVAYAVNDKPIRLGLTAVVITENLRVFDQLSEYLEYKIDHKVEFVMRKSYREVMNLLDSGVIDFAWICGFPYVQLKEKDTAQLLSVPIYRGEPLYHSYIIVPQNSPYKDLMDLKGKVFAYSDPDSNSGFLYPVSLLAKEGNRPETFFRQTFFTFNHAETVQAVAENFADGGAVDSYIWESLASTNPELTKRTRIIKKSQSFGFPPIVFRSDLDSTVVNSMKEALEKMEKDPQGKALLGKFKLDGFGEFPDSLFHSIRSLRDKINTDENGRILRLNE